MQEEATKKKRLWAATEVNPSLKRKKLQTRRRVVSICHVDDDRSSNDICFILSDFLPMSLTSRERRQFLFLLHARCGLSASF